MSSVFTHPIPALHTYCILSGMPAQAHQVGLCVGELIDHYGSLHDRDRKASQTLGIAENGTVLSSIVAWPRWGCLLPLVVDEPTSICSRGLPRAMSLCQIITGE